VSFGMAAILWRAQKIANATTADQSGATNARLTPSGWVAAAVWTFIAWVGLVAEPIIYFLQHGGVR
jgi:hypothetical protein